MSTTGKLDRIRAVSARDGFTRVQRFGAAAVGIVTVPLLVWHPFATLGWLVQLAVLGFSAIVACKAYLYLNTGGTAILPATLLPDADCPPYVALVPCYREAKVLPQLLARLRDLDYPRDRLRVLLLLEADDAETRAVAATIPMPPYLQQVIVPVSWMPGLRGKPRALMYAVHQGLVDGEYCVIWDAEDMPAQDQLRKAATAFAQTPDVACLQAELRWWNAEQNWLTRMMAAAYAHHFALVMPGLCATGGVVPLGGTSNHLRVAALREVGWWDPYNVTEDLDLGVRLRRAGHRVLLLPSITWEEATGTFRQQRNQMSRWIKGHAVTAEAHLRHPIALCRDLGAMGTLSFVSIVLAAHPTTLVAPAFWLMTALYVMIQLDFIREITPFAAFYLGTICLVANAFFIVASMYAILKTRQFRLWPWLVLLPIHWVVVGTAASFKATWELLRGQKTYWDKTPRTHLFAETAGAANASLPLGQPVPAKAQPAPANVVIGRAHAMIQESGS